MTVNEPARNNHIHGFIKNAPFKVLERREGCIRTILKNNGQYYPFPFVIIIEDALEDKGWRRQMMLQNAGDSAMPYTLGFHAVFRTPEYCCVPISARCEVNDCYLPTGQMLPLDALQQDCRSGWRPDGSRLSGSYTPAEIRSASASTQ